MLLLLQEALEYIEEQYRILKKLDVVTIASHRRYRRIQYEIYEEIINLLDDVQQSAPVKVEEYVGDSFASGAFYAGNMVPESLNEVAANLHGTFVSTQSDVKYEVDEIVPFPQSSSGSVTSYVATLQENELEYPSNVTQEIRSDKLANGDDSNSKLSNSRHCKNEENLNDKQPVIDTGESKCNAKEDGNIDATMNQDARLVKFNKIAKTPTVIQISEVPQFPADEDALTCKACNLNFLSSFEMESHKISHMKERSFKCELCKKAFINRTRLRSHQMIHFREMSFACDVCNKRFILQNDLTMHKKKFKCAGFSSTHGTDGILPGK